MFKIAYAVGMGVIGTTFYTLSIFQESSIAKQIYVHVATGMFISMAIILSSPVDI